MKRIAKFDKVTFEQFKNDFKDCFDYGQGKTDEEIKAIYEAIKLPKRSTKGSAGYDFVIPVDLVLNPNSNQKIPTGIRCSINDNWVLKLYPRSGFGFKYRIRMNNTVGIIDSDYFYSDNEGHIFVKISNEGNKTVKFQAGEKFVQGIFVEYGITVDDDATGIRNGGFGSTDV